MNRLPGRIVQVEIAGSIALLDVEASGCRFAAMTVGASDEAAAWRIGMPVTLLFKETEVSLAKNLSGLISMRNRIPATVIAVERGQVLTKVTLDFHGCELVSIITTRSSHSLSLEVGDQVEGLVKANEMTLLPEAAP